MIKFGLINFILVLYFARTFLAVHLTDKNLVTDPSGITFFKDKYHIFYQFFTLNANTKRDVYFFSSVQWGHATSKDLLKWSEHASVIQGFTDPEKTYFRGREIQNISILVPFSGSCIVDNENVTGLKLSSNEPVLLVYTSLSKFLYNEIDEFTKTDFIFSTVYMYYSYDGYNYTRYNEPMINKSITLRNFRDPSVSKFKNNHYNLVMTENMKFAIHQSSNLLNWRRVSDIDFKYLPKPIEEIETPNLIKIDNTSLLVFSANIRDEEPVKHYSSIRYAVGEFDGYEFKLSQNPFNETHEFDGPDMYAISIFNRTMIGSIHNWKYVWDISFNGTLSYPRHLDLMVVNGSTYMTQTFIRLDAFSAQEFELNDLTEDEISYNFNVNKPYYIKIGLNNSDCESDCDFDLKFEDTNNTIIIGYKHSTNDFYLDRSKSKIVNSYYNDVHRHKAKPKKFLNDKIFEIEIILDTNTIEMLADQGLVAISALHLNDRIFQSLTINTNRNYRTNLKINYYES